MSEHDISQHAAEVVLDPTSFYPGWEESSFTLSVDVPSGYAWSLSKPTWISVDKTSGVGDESVAVSIHDNYGSSKNGDIVVSLDNNTSNSETCNVGQGGFTSGNVYVRPTTYDTGSSSDSFELTIKTDTDWDIPVLPQWVTVSSRNGTGETTITVYIGSNDTGSTRSKYLTVQTSSDSADCEIIQYG